MIKRVLIGLGAAFGLLLAVVLLRAATSSSQQVPVIAQTVIASDLDGAVERLAEAVRFETIAKADPTELDPAPFAAFHAWITQTYPGLSGVLRREVVDGHSLLYTWKGLDPALPPLLLLAHQDVVPVEDSTLPDWEQPPFAGVVADGWIWGRGTLDDKISLVAILESVESLWRAGFQPQRTVMLAFGHDEEVSGAGARAIAALLKERGLTFQMILDEGLAVTHGIVPGLDQPAALIGLAEKGYLSIDLTVAGDGGHSSMPPAHTAVGVLAEAITRLEANPMPAHMDGPIAGMFGALGPEMGFGNKLVFSNLWLLGGVVRGKLEAANSTNASIRTTTAVTMVAGGVKENVLPQEATATVNFRILPGDTIEDVLRHVEEAVDDSRVTVRMRPGFRSEPPAISSTTSPGWEVMQRTVRQSFPDAVVAPHLSVGATDARAYTGLSDSIYRFSPLRLHKDTHDTGRIHGTNERVSVENFGEAVQFYGQLITNAAGPAG